MSDDMKIGRQMAKAVERAYQEFGDENIYTFSVSLLAALAGDLKGKELEDLLADHTYNVRMVMEATDVAGRA